jgi:gamma-glutamylcyclotransferase (GGCT)/AIG2-like uncharacterized protein YtfP
MSNDYDWRTNLFVYGTLKKNGRLHSVLGNSSEFVGTYVTADNKYDLFSYAKSFPILVAREKGFRIRGEVWSVTPETMDRVNAIESGSSYYPFQIDVMNEVTKEYEVGSVLVFMVPGNNHSLMPVKDIEAVDNIKEWSI